MGKKQLETFFSVLSCRPERPLRTKPYRPWYCVQAEVLTSGPDKIRAVMRVPEAAGIEFLNHGQPGVRLSGKSNV